VWKTGTHGQNGRSIGLVADRRQTNVETIAAAVHGTATTVAAGAITTIAINRGAITAVEVARAVTEGNTTEDMATIAMVIVAATTEVTLVGAVLISRRTAVYIMPAFVSLTLVAGDRTIHISTVDSNRLYSAPILDPGFHLRHPVVFPFCCCDVLKCELLFLNLNRGAIFQCPSANHNYSYCQPAVTFNLIVFCFCPHTVKPRYLGHL
jgi:hypothetical protein